MTGSAYEFEASAHDNAERENRHGGVGHLLLTVRVVGVVVGAALVPGAVLVALNSVLLHGFSSGCSDGSPDYDPTYCGITWRPGFPALATAMVGLLLVAVSVWRRRFTGWLLVATGASTVLVALYLLWVQTWVPLTPAYPEPAAPQYVQLAVGVVATVSGLVVLRRRGARAAGTGEPVQAHLVPQDLGPVGDDPAHLD